jgi:hypothetical protein
VLKGLIIFVGVEACFHLDVEAVLLFLLFMEFPDQVSCCFHLDVEVVLLFMEFSDQVSNGF